MTHAHRTAADAATGAVARRAERQEIRLVGDFLACLGHFTNARRHGMLRRRLFVRGMYVDVDRFGPFSLDDAFVRGYRNRPVAWGFGTLSWLIFRRSYSRDDEAWWQTCRRVVEGMFTVLRCHCLEHGRTWEPSWAADAAREAYDRLWSFRWTPPGRGLWIMGTRFLYERGGAALNNCGFVSTKDIDGDFSGPFSWMLQMAMLGVGVGFDTRGKGRLEIMRPHRSDDVLVVDDSREGWAAAVARLLDAYVGKHTVPRFDLAAIRAAGAPLRSFGGRASGPKPLRKLLAGLEELLEARVGRVVDAALIVDAMNQIGRCVVAGGQRRSAQIALGDPNDEQFLALKDDREKVRAWRWASNNSVLASVGMDYTDIARRTIRNGEPGYFWLDTARQYGRLVDPPTGADEGALGTNPCVEQTLWDRELCTLVETFPARHDSHQDFQATLRCALLYAKSVTLVGTHDERTNAVMQRNRRIGLSMTGIVQAISRHGYRRFMQWCQHGYQHVRQLDDACAAWLAVPRSIKLTSVKPSGTVSLLAGATPGVHWDHAPYYIRRVRMSSNNPLVSRCAEAGYAVEPDAYAEDTSVVSFPISVPHLRRGKADVPLREKVDLAAQLQRYWSDNQVSCTADFDPEHESDQIGRVLSSYDDRLKAIVFLPASGHGYEQPPYETISADAYAAMSARLRPLRGRIEHEHEMEARFCEGGLCDIDDLGEADGRRNGPSRSDAI